MGVQGVGEVEFAAVDVTSPTTGRIVALPNQTSGQWSVYDRVQAGDVIARIEEQSGDASKTVEIQSPISGTLVACALLARSDRDSGSDSSRRLPPTMAGTSSATSRKRARCRAKPGMQVTLRSRRRRLAAAGERGRTKWACKSKGFRVTSARTPRCRNGARRCGSRYRARQPCGRGRWWTCDSTGRTRGDRPYQVFQQWTAVA